MKVKNPRFVLAATLTVLLIIPNIVLAFNQNLWLDEIITVNNCASANVMEIIRWAKSDVHPPLYYLMLRLVSGMTGGSLIAMKLLSVAAHMAILMCGLFFVQKQFGLRAMLFFDIFVTVMPGMFTYSVEIRMYEWAMCFVALCGISAYFVMKRGQRRDFRWLCITALLCAYTHYYSLVCAIFIYGILFLWVCFKRDKEMIRAYMFCALITIVGYMPWVPVFLQQTQGVKEDFWITGKGIYYYLSQMFDSKVPYSLYVNMLLILGAVVLLMWKRKEMKKDTFFWSLGCTLALPAIFMAVYLFSVFLSPIIVVRYLLIIMMLLALGMSVVCKYIPKPLFCVIMLFYVVCGVVLYRTACEEQFVDTKGTVEVIRNSGEEVIYSEIPDIHIYLDFYGLDLDVQEWNEQDALEEGVLISYKTQDELQQLEGIAVEEIAPLQLKTVTGHIYRIKLGD